MSASVQMENKCVYCCPFKWVAIPIVLETIATAMFGVAAFSCKTFVSTLTDDFAEITDDVEFGYWSYHYRGECNAFKKEFDDDDYGVDEPPLKAGKAFGVMGMTLGGLLFLFMLTFSFLSFPKVHKALFMACGGMCAFLAILSGLLLIGLANEDFCDDKVEAFSTVSCKPNGVGYCAVIAVIFYLAASISIFVMNCLGGLTPRRMSAPSTGKTLGDSPRSMPKAEDITAVEMDEGNVVKTFVASVNV